MNSRAVIAKQLLRRIAPHVYVQVILPNGEKLGPAKPNLPTMTIHDENFFVRLGNDLKIGLGESFMERISRSGRSINALRREVVTHCAGLDAQIPQICRTISTKT
jgi:hypothetical protein